MRRRHRWTWTRSSGSSGGIPRPPAESGTETHPPPPPLTRHVSPGPESRQPFISRDAKLTSGLSANFFLTTLLRLPSIPLTDFLRRSSLVSTSVTVWPVAAATCGDTSLSVQCAQLKIVTCTFFFFFLYRSSYQGFVFRRGDDGSLCHTLYWTHC